MACSQQLPAKSTTLREVASAQDPLVDQDLTFDSSFAQLSIEYLHVSDTSILTKLANSPGAFHLLDHARNFDYDVPKDSTQTLVSHLLALKSERLANLEICKGSLEYFTSQMLAEPHWLNDSLRYLPGDFRYHGSLFLTYGYDIGVAFGSSASLNCGHSSFSHPRELVYYAVHELHHVGFMSYQPPPRLSELKTCHDLLGLVEYSTQMEGMAVLAAYERRREERALDGDPDYVALQDEKRMQRDEEQYFADLNYLEQRGDAPADADAWAVISRMSSGERLWYRVGARMAQTIEGGSGRPRLIALIKEGPGAFLGEYQRITQKQVAGCH
ncbi:MAG TPA: DUF5700 domain-containing putative Zn-dependent protease [Terriglobales bacterium]|nr:DUF5700 domain-containing putative Zn-dependent protease [Terriglobales bacterium]